MWKKCQNTWQQKSLAMKSLAKKIEHLVLLLLFLFHWPKKWLWLNKLELHKIKHMGERWVDKCEDKW